jgi:acyl carrier protein
MTREEVASKVKATIADILNIEPSSITESSTFESLGVDSLDMMQIIMKFEEVFTIEKIDDAEAAAMKTVGDAVNKLCVLLKVA